MTLDSIVSVLFVLACIGLVVSVIVWAFTSGRHDRGSR